VSPLPLADLEARPLGTRRSPVRAEFSGAPAVGAGGPGVAEGFVGAAQSQAALMAAQVQNGPVHLGNGADLARQSRDRNDGRFAAQCALGEASGESHTQARRNKMNRGQMEYGANP
jgi:hypothetical protein